MATRMHRVTFRAAGLAALLAAVMLSFAGVPTAQASHTVDAELQCSEVTGFSIALSYAGSARASQFYWRVDNGAWENSDWYYTDRYLWYVWNGAAWQLLNNGADPLSFSFVERGVVHTVEAWEKRYSYYTRSTTWVYLGSCQAMTADYGNGIYFR